MIMDISIYHGVGEIMGVFAISELLSWELLYMKVLCLKLKCLF